MVINPQVGQTVFYFQDTRISKNPWIGKITRISYMGSVDLEVKHPEGHTEVRRNVLLMDKGDAIQTEEFAELAN